MINFVTGGCGFIGSAVVRQMVNESDATVVNIDKLTYAGNLGSVAFIAKHKRYIFEHMDICDRQDLDSIFTRYQPHAIIHLAAETHVDRSIDAPADFLRTNVIGTYTLLEAAYNYWSGLSRRRRESFRFLHVSTDEVFGSLGSAGSFREDSPYDPKSPYAASKASADHLVRAWHSTYGLPTLVSNCSNNYGPCQHPEKLIPHTIHKALLEEPIPVYGTGENVRDWLYVEDHARALRLLIEHGGPGETYNVGGNDERKNLEVVRMVCEILDDLCPRQCGRPYANLISFVEDRPGHDLRYAIDCSKLRREFDWRPETKFDQGLRSTVVWYLENEEWVKQSNYVGHRLGKIGER